MNKRVVSIHKKYALIQQSWLTQRDVMDLAECGPARAAEIRRELAEKVSPRVLPMRIPTGLLIDHLDIDVEYITRVALLSLKN